MHYDLIVLGGGPGGYLAAERAGKAKLKVLCIEDTHFGGTCLNEGCIPTKTLLNSAKLYHHAKDSAAYGVHTEGAYLDHSEVVARKEKVIRTLVGGVEMTLKASRVETLRARGTITGRTAEGYTRVSADGKEYTAKDLIIATGSVCSEPPIPGLKEGLSSGFVLTNREILELRELPQELVILGGGVIGLELAAYFGMAGVKATVVEMLDHIGGPMEKDFSDLLRRNLEKLGVSFLLGAKVTGIGEGRVLYETDGKPGGIASEKVLLSIGRRPNTQGIGLETIGVETSRGAIVTDDRMRTNIPGVYAVGDANGKIMLAHTAYREAEVAVNTILGKPDHMRYSAIPSVIYTVPEYASVGETETSAKAKGLDVKAVRLPMAYSGRYVAENDGGDGFCRLVFDKKRDTLIGAQILANSSSEFILAAAAFIELELTVSDMRELVFPHPTVGEILREAVWQY